MDHQLDYCCLFGGRKCYNSRELDGRWESGYKAREQVASTLLMVQVYGTRTCKFVD